MKELNKDVTSYITQSESFAKPILKHWRHLVNENCPDVVEAIKWGIPHFDYKGDFMCVMASYKSHCSFSFLKAELMNDPRLKESKKLKPVQRFMGKISSVDELPADKEFIKLLKEAMSLNEKGLKLPVIKPAKAQKTEVPDYFVQQLKSNPKAEKVFEAGSPSFRKNYLTWIIDAKTETTRNKRIEQSLEWIAEGKDRFWQYKK